MLVLGGARCHAEERLTHLCIEFYLVLIHPDITLVGKCLNQDESTTNDEGTCFRHLLCTVTRAVSQSKAVSSLARRSRIDEGVNVLTEIAHVAKVKGKLRIAEVHALIII